MLWMDASSMALNSASDLLGRQPVEQRPRKARHDAVIPAQPVVGFFPRIAARQRDHPHDLGMPDKIGVEIVLLGQGELEHDHAGPPAAR